MKNILLEQQKSLESLKREKIRNNIFLSGIPNKVTINDNETTDSDTIVNHVLNFVLPTINEEDYKVNKTFEPKVGFTRHSAILSFTSYGKKIELLGKCKNHWLRKVFIRSEKTPLKNKENSRLFSEFKKLRERHDGDVDTLIKLEKGKLYYNGVVFNINRQIF